MKTVELIAIGDEVLKGFVANTNGAFLSQELAKLGITVARHTVLPDDAEALRSGVSEALGRADIVITTGGLGPTCDDHTRNTIATLVDSDFRSDPVVLQELERRYGKDFPSLADQARVPSKAEVFLNTVGTAPGLLFEHDKAMLFVLPGVPAEMRCMFTEQVVPWLMKRIPANHRAYCHNLSFGGLRESDVDPLLRELEGEYPDVAIGIYPMMGLLLVQLSVVSDSEEAADRQLHPVVDKLTTVFGSNLFYSPIGKIEDALQIEMVKKGWTLSTAESCTGGGISAKAASIPGASGYFEGGFVTYSNLLKSELLGVPSELFESHGAVSEPVVEAMVRGLLEKTGTDWGVAVSGLAGPTGGTIDKPVGTVCAAIARRGGPIDKWTFFSRGSREMVVGRAINLVLYRLYSHIMAAGKD